MLKTYIYAVYEIICKNMMQSDRPQTNIRHVRISRWIPMDKSTHSDYVIFIAFPPQYWLHISASVLRCTYISCLVLYYRLLEDFMAINFHWLL
jgi:hypothetical protein